MITATTTTTTMMDTIWYNDLLAVLHVAGTLLANGVVTE